MALDQTQKIRIIYPDDRFVPMSTIVSWARDAAGRIDTFVEAVAYLEDSGRVTFHKSIDDLLNSPGAYDLLDPAPAFDGVGTAAEDERIDKLLSSPDPDITGGE